MTTRPRLRTFTRATVAGLAAVGLFVVMAAVFLTAEFGTPAGFEAGASITESIGFAMFDIGGAEVASEGFLAAFEIVDIVLVAALVGAVMLARREDSATFGLATDGGRDGSDREGTEHDPSRPRSGGEE